MTSKTLRAALSCRVSTSDQTTENQRLELQRYADARGWTVTEYLDEGVSGPTERRPALDLLMIDARRRRFDIVVVWRLDRLGRNLKHLIVTVDEFAALGSGLTSARFATISPELGRHSFWGISLRRYTVA